MTVDIQRKVVRMVEDLYEKLTDANVEGGQLTRRNDAHMSLKLPLITSPETIAVMEWLTSDVERYRYWSEQARIVSLQYGMEVAPHQLSMLLSEQLTKDLALSGGLGEALMTATFKRVNYFELAMGLLLPQDNPGRFDEQLLEVPTEETQEDDA